MFSSGVRLGGGVDKNKSGRLRRSFDCDQCTHVVVCRRRGFERHVGNERELQRMHPQPDHRRRAHRLDRHGRTTQHPAGLLSAGRPLNKQLSTRSTVTVFTRFIKQCTYLLNPYIYIYIFIVLLARRWTCSNTRRRLPYACAQIV